MRTIEEIRFALPALELALTTVYMKSVRKSKKLINVNRDLFINSYRLYLLLKAETHYPYDIPYANYLLMELATRINNDLPEINLTDITEIRPQENYD